MDAPVLLRDAYPHPPVVTAEGKRSFRRVLALLGLGATAAAAWYGARYIYSLQNAKQAQASSVEANTNEDRLDINANVNPAFFEEQRNKVAVVLFQAHRGYFTPCIAPFPLKLETFLRIANIPYTVDTDYVSPNSAAPWMSIDGREILESHDCIPSICKTFGIDLERNGRELSRKTMSRLVGVMLENEVYWGIALWRWVFDEGKSLKLVQPWADFGQEAVAEIADSVVRAAWYHGLGRMSKEQLMEVMFVDLADLSAALGNHNYFLGQSPGEVDCSAFALLTQMLWNLPGSPFEDAIKKYPNLVNYVHRIRQRFWPDWNQTLQKLGESELPKKLLYPTREFKITRSEISALANKDTLNQSTQDAGNAAISSLKMDGDSPMNAQGQLHSPMGMNTTVVNQDEKLQNEQDALLQQQQQFNQLNGLNYLNTGHNMAHLRGFIDPQSTQQGQLLMPSYENHQLESESRFYDPRDQYLDSQDPFVPSEDAYLANNPHAYQYQEDYSYPTAQDYI